LICLSSSVFTLQMGIWTSKTKHGHSWLLCGLDLCMP
jgi:hypothetical protein